VCSRVTRVLKFYFIHLFSKSLVLGRGGSYRIRNSARTQRVVQPSCLIAFERAHARRVCDPSFPSDAASDTVQASHPVRTTRRLGCWRQPCFRRVNRPRVLHSEVQNCCTVSGRSVTYRQSARMMFRQVLDVDKVITQLLAGRKKTDKQANICVF